MLQKRIKYTDYKGNEREEDFYFNLNKAELTLMNLSYPGGMDNYLQRLIDKQDQPGIIEMFKMLISKSYGEVSEDGKRFIKSDELSKEFEQTEAYSEMIIELLSGGEQVVQDFITAVMPNIPKEPDNKSPIPYPVNK